MWPSSSSLKAIVDAYGGLVLGFAVLAGVLWFNQLIFRRRWKSYPTREQYLAAHRTASAPRR